MSDESGSEPGGSPRSGFGPFLVGLAIGAALGALLAPEPGSRIRARLGKRAVRLREDLGDIVDELRPVLAAGGSPDASPREALRQRLTAARTARTARTPHSAGPAPALPGGGAGTPAPPPA